MSLTVVTRFAYQVRNRAHKINSGHTLMEREWIDIYIYIYMPLHVCRPSFFAHHQAAFLLRP
jgi:hypothetical protein